VRCTQTGGFGGNPERKKFLAFLICAEVVFSKMERTFFFLMFRPKRYSGSAAGRNADSVLPKLFSGEKDLAKPRLISRAEEGSGEESARACFGEAG